MTGLNTTKTMIAAFGMTVMASGAFAAAHGDMSCADFGAMSNDDQLALVEERNAGREGQRVEATDTAGEATSGDSSVEDATDGGRENQREMATGADMHASVMEHCANDPESSIEAAMDAQMGN